MAKINGEDVRAEGMSIAAYLAQAGFDTAKVVVEYNLEILSKDAYAATLIKANDSIEVLTFVGGG